MKTQAMEKKPSKRHVREQFMVDGDVPCFLIGVGSELRNKNNNNDDNDDENNDNNDDNQSQLVTKKECKALARKMSGIYCELSSDSLEEVDALFEKALSMVEKGRKKQQHRSDGGLFGKLGKLLKKAS
jgi:hypothetical protein